MKRRPGSVLTFDTMECGFDPIRSQNADCINQTLNAPHSSIHLLAFDGSFPYLAGSSNPLKLLAGRVEPPQSVIGSAVAGEKSEYRNITRDQRCK